MKQYLVKRTVFNPESKQYETDTIHMNEKAFNVFTSTKEYQLSIRDNSVATPIKLEIVKEFKDHFEYLDYEKEQREANKPKVEKVKTEKKVEIKIYKEKGLNMMSEDKLRDILITSYNVEPSIVSGVTKDVLIPAILEKQESKKKE